MKKLMDKVHAIVPARMLRTAFVVVSCMMALAISVFAEDPPSATSTISTAMTSAFQTMIADLMTLIAAILPTALTVVGVMLLIGVGIKSFKKMVNKAG